MVLFLLSILVCSYEKYKISGKVFHDDNLLKEMYEKSSDTLSIHGQQYGIYVDLSRDFFPGVLPKANPLLAYFIFYELDSLTINPDIKVENLYVIHENSIWKSSPINNTKSYSPNYLQKYISKDGPEWSTGILVDVILEVEALDVSNFLIARNQQIQKTE